MLVPATYLSGHHTERLDIRPLNDEHIPHWKTFLEYEETTRYFPAFMRTDAAEQAPIWIKRQQERYATGLFGLQALHLEDGSFIGQCGLITQEVDGESVLEIGYHLLPEFHGKGYASEAAIYFREFARKNNIVPFVVSIIHKDNLPSQAVAGRNGMQPWKETTWRDYPVVIYRYDF